MVLAIKSWIQRKVLFGVGRCRLVSLVARYIACMHAITLWQLQVKTRAEFSHLFTPLADQKCLIEKVSNWVRSLDVVDSDG